jgi:hypothetical protein
MVWVAGQACGFFWPALTAGFIRGEAPEDIEARGEVVGHQEGTPRLVHVVRGVIVLLLHGGLLQGAVHAVPLAIGPGMVDLRAPVFAARLVAEALAERREGVSGPRAVSALESSAGESCLDCVGYGGHQVA